MGKKRVNYMDYAKAQDGKDMDYAGYKAFAKANDADYMDEESYGKAGAAYAKAQKAGYSDDYVADKMGKSEDGTIDTDTLRKSIEDYEAVEDAIGDMGDSTSRETYLKSRADAGTISKSEQAELGRIWAGMDDNGNLNEPLNKSIDARIREDNPEAGDLIDASALMKSWVNSIDESLSEVTEGVTRDGAATRQFIRAQGTLQKAMGSVILELADRLEKSFGVIDALEQRLGTVEREPAPRRSAGNHDRRQIIDPSRIAKSETGLKKSDALAGLRTLMKSAADRGDEAAMDAITKATARYEQGFGLPPNMVAAIEALAA
jgi:hypothetical protein